MWLPRRCGGPPTLAAPRGDVGPRSGTPGVLLRRAVRGPGLPGQAISYELGGRAWPAGRDAARRAAAGRGQGFDARALHMAALSQGSLGFDGLVTEPALP